MTVAELKDALVKGYPVTLKKGTERYNFSFVSGIITRYDSQRKVFVISAEVKRGNSVTICRPEDLSEWEPGK